MQDSTSHDWEQVVIRGKGKYVEKLKERNSTSELRSKLNGSNTDTMSKLQHATDVEKIKLINPKIKNTIIHRRTELKLTQKELANRSQVQLKLVQLYETGKTKADQAILQKLQNVLGCKLMGKEFGSINM